MSVHCSSVRAEYVLPDPVWLARLGGELTRPGEGYGGKRNLGLITGRIELLDQIIN